MDCRIVKWSCCVCVMLMLLASLVQAAPVSSSPLSGSYRLVQKRNFGSQMQVVLQVRLLNRGSESLSIQQLSLREAAGQVHSANLTLDPRSSRQITQQFTVSRQELNNWRRGLGPLLQLQGRTSSGSKILQTVRLDGFFGGGVK